MKKTVLFSKRDCMGCYASEEMMKAKKLVFSVVKLDEDGEALNTVKELGFMSAPVIVVYNEDKVVEAWSGFRPERIEGLT